jgi:hypothetical protein
MQSNRDLIGQLLSRLYGALDEQDYVEVSRCFLPDGEWRRQGKLLRGRDAIVAQLSERGPGFLVHHVYSNCHVEKTDELNLKVRFLLLAFLPLGGQARAEGVIPIAASPQVGFCDAEIACMDGQWLIRKLAARVPTFAAGTQA